MTIEGIKIEKIEINPDNIRRRTIGYRIRIDGKVRYECCDIDQALEIKEAFEAGISVPWMFTNSR